MFEYSAPVNFGDSTTFFNQAGFPKFNFTIILGVAQLYNVAPGISFGS